MAASIYTSPETFFTEFRAIFIEKMACKYSSISREDIEDLYQDSFLILVENYSAGKVNPETGKGNVKTNWWNYLLSVGTRQMSKRLKRLSDTSSLESNANIENMDGFMFQTGAYISADEESEAALRERRIIFIESELSMLSENVAGIITDKYILGLPDTEIARRRDYANASTIKAKRSQIIKRIKDKKQKIAKAVA
ncbi:MAG: hypothetical protein K2J48_04175 [Muribaculaceae bacterium]|nr:hypothetical protein [Muribaculaceae bacterium]